MSIIAHINAMSIAWSKKRSNRKGKAARPTYKIPFSESHVTGLLKLHVLVETSVDIFWYISEYSADFTICM